MLESLVGGWEHLKLMMSRPHRRPIKSESLDRSLRVEPLRVGGWIGGGQEEGTTFSQTGGKGERR